MRFLNLSVAALAFFWSSAAAQDSDSVSLGSKITVSGVVDFSMGEIMEGMYKAITSPKGPDPNQTPHSVSHVWFGNPLSRLNLAFQPSENITTLIGFEGALFINTFPPQLNTKLGSNGATPLLPQFMDWRLHQAQGTFSFITNESMSLKLSLGLMPYKYNPEVRNLGEFLFRTGTYPFIIINSFNFPLARLSGARAHFERNLENIGISVDQFVLTERNMPPMNDLSLATIASVKAFKMIDLGGGVDFAHLIPLNGDLTTPAAAKYVTDEGDSGTYTFQATKLMGRMTIDPIGTLRGGSSLLAEIFGENGGKIYGEAAVVGLNNYPASDVIIKGTDRMNPWGYNEISERMPWMAGVNIPLWKILDVCALEIEKYPAPYPNDYYQA
ncbi:MAG: hypothetical protein JXA71_03235, partial [Chitinispirillaceae bacterium]|nr:hypothetical protein [Chitinispirillaceae bacterium]